ncbi:hypothetical protein H4219_006380 [Mycoemilia scoparia]|uniref:Uncharacterized protein n=1 Tax=Mycoemilia scoparia TaxID=417184 RepID=A0A9W8DM20_9FUNG|nr:hypothetical protein H4219_006380 [Mycoemilia scoparia]
MINQDASSPITFGKMPAETIARQVKFIEDMAAEHGVYINRVKDQWLAHYMLCKGWNNNTSAKGKVQRSDDRQNSPMSATSPSVRASRNSRHRSRQQRHRRADHHQTPYSRSQTVEQRNADIERFDITYYDSLSEDELNML